ncbi:hypothetical protein BJX68DRAFT_238289 [Aspergillus pseudodeflectus]|uniref:Uncharacterized protein n=1 Tax=Aspergillus pseudodeflectus TaxID=176178 RepID=A0ABR4K8L5_9EURO
MEQSAGLICPTSTSTRTSSAQFRSSVMVQPIPEWWSITPSPRIIAHHQCPSWSTPNPSLPLFDVSIALIWLVMFSISPCRGSITMGEISNRIRSTCSFHIPPV